MVLVGSATHHHQIAVEIVAAFKAGFSHRLKAVTLVEAYGPGILVIYRESDTVGNASKCCCYQVLRGASAVMRCGDIAPRQLWNTVCQYDTQGLRCVVDQTETHDGPGFLQYQYILIRGKKRGLEARWRKVFADVSL